MTIFVEQVAPTTYTEDVDAELKELQKMNDLIGQLAERITTSNSPVIAVDMSENWQDRFFIDNIHYNLAGALVVANRYYENMQSVLDMNKPIKVLAMGDSRVEGHRPEGPN